MRIAWIGSKKTRTLRNRILEQGFRKKGIDLIDLSIPAEFNPYTSKFHMLFSSYNRLLRSLRYIVPKDIDLIFASYPSQDILPVLTMFKRIRKVPLIFDPFISIYYSYTQDYHLLSRESLPARVMFEWERIALEKSSLITAETDVLCDFFSKAYRIPRKRFSRAFLGADMNIFNPQKYQKSEDLENSGEKFIVSFIGEFIPSQGVKFILDSAKHLEKCPEIEICLTGGLPDPLSRAHSYITKKNLKNIILEPYIPLEHVPKRIALSDIQLGIFGTTPKAQMVLSNKVVCAAAMGKSIITGYSKASEELFEHQRNIWFTEFGNAKGIADSIIALYEDEKLRKKLGIEARKTFLDHLTPEKIVDSILDAFVNLKDFKY